MPSSSSSSYSLFGVVAIAFLVSVSSPVLSSKVEEDKENLLQGLNGYRQAQKLPPFEKNAKAYCIAEKIAEVDKDHPCNITTANSTVTARHLSQIENFEHYAEKCKVDLNTTADAIVMPVCVPDMVEPMLLANYTQTQYAQYLNNSKFVGAGLGVDVDWMVVILTTAEHGGSFAGSGAGSVVASMGAPVLVVLLGLFLVGNL
ncbi:uncharacterized GPI-anchored protein At3g06035-like [Cucurbita moschata]|uniref:Uncharacterized GPI-anchored protein At3g06035-like n=1 Tax=Cucurbita moschata TaxID=3662 RepID=A0A6J1FD58_CUCMO|nr:uncharacterized GPI-anchored protein At3g06035-like [Cucurbita moschata]